MKVLIIVNSFFLFTFMSGLLAKRSWEKLFQKAEENNGKIDVFVRYIAIIHALREDDGWSKLNPCWDMGEQIVDWRNKEIWSISLVD